MSWADAAGQVLQPADDLATATVGRGGPGGNGACLFLAVRLPLVRSFVPWAVIGVQQTTRAVVLCHGGTQSLQL